MKKICIILLFFSYQYSSAQFIEIEKEEKKKNKPSKQKIVKKDTPSKWIDKMYFGGGISFGFTNRSLLLGASPIVGYFITPNLLMGTGAIYQYLNNRILSVPIRQDKLGGLMFARYYIKKRYFPHIEYNIVHYTNTISKIKVNQGWYNAFLVGGGIFFPFGKGRSGLNILLLYDLNSSGGNAFIPNIQFSF